MTRTPFMGVLGMVLGLAAGLGCPVLAAQSGAESPSATALAPDQALLTRYCVTCHNQRTNTAGLALDMLDLERVEIDAEVWEKVVRKIRTGMMPPSGASRPDRSELDRFAAGLETRLDQAAARSPNPGAPALSRLNRTEYANAVRDLLDLEVDVTVLLPGDESSQGFDNIAETLGVSPALAQGYVSSAMKISRLAVGDRTMLPVATTYGVSGLAQDRHIDGLPLGTRGGMVVRHTFPLDGEYEFSVNGTNFTLDGARIEADNLRRFRLPVSAGMHTLGVSIVDQRRAAGVDDLWSVYSSGGPTPSVTVNGPFDHTGPGAIPSRRRIFVCYPEAGADELPCAERIVRELSRRAFRRPAGEVEIDRLMRFYQEGRANGDFEVGVERALAGVLVSPGFVFRAEEDADVPEGSVYRVDDLALASRLSFFLWSSIPDDELLDLAGAGRLGDPAGLEAVVRRMLEDPKADALVENFAGQWLRLRNLAEVDPVRPRALANRLESEGFNENLRQAFRRETELFLESIVLEDRSILDLIDADYTFVDERLASHYDIPGVTGSYFRRITLDANSPRRGLIGQGSILTLTSAPDRTSPVVRGQWILENILGSPAPDPPPNVETNLDADPESVETRSLRERMTAHRADPVCASCHQIMDPIGFALENFDRIGQWREFDGGTRIDPSGRLVDGTELSGIGDLRQALLDRSEAFATTAVQKLLTYALGRAVEYDDMPAVRGIVRDAAADDYRFSSLILGIVRSVPFRMKLKTPPAEVSSPPDVAAR